jgi:hypothetical protein
MLDFNCGVHREPFTNSRAFFRIIASDSEWLSNRSLNRTAEKLRFSLPSALRTAAAG